MKTLSSLPYGPSTEKDILDKAFAEEIAFLYYLSLYDEKYFPGELYYSTRVRAFYGNILYRTNAFTNNIISAK
jgi:hypothetical protein